MALPLLSGGERIRTPEYLDRAVEVFREALEGRLRARGVGRLRRITIVALARKLLVALWRFVETGLVPDGAELKA